jgi:PAS domain S-box-containing protein
VDALLNDLPCGIVSFIDDGSIVAANATLARLLGYATEELIGQHVERLLTIPGRIFYQTHLFPMLRLHEKADEIFLLLRHKDGSEVGALANAARRERDGRMVNDCVLLEVRQRRKYEDELLRARRDAESANTTLAAQREELQALNEQLREHANELERARLAADDANRAKSQFLATMSHELRTPLNAIGGYVQLIELGIHGPVTDAQREALDRITRSQRLLLRLINDVLNLARIEAGRVEYDVRDTPLAEVVASVVPMVDPQMAIAGLAFLAEVSADLVVCADREKLQQILINLLTNALKFTPAGGSVSLKARRDEGGTRVFVDVSDTGIGIPHDKLGSIFEPFVQVDVGHARRTEGSGLGLAISRDLARGMGGELSAVSDARQGSTFTLALPSA